VTSKFLRPLVCLAALACLVLPLVTACATSSGTAPDSASDSASGTEPAAASADEGMIQDSEEMTNRRFRMKVSFPGFSEMVNMREGQTITFQRPDGTYVLTPWVSKTELGQIDMEVSRQTSVQKEEARATFRISEPYDFSHEFKNLDWPFLEVRVLSVHPPLRPGLN